NPDVPGRSLEARVRRRSDDRRPAPSGPPCAGVSSPAGRNAMSRFARAVLALVPLVLVAGAAYGRAPSAKEYMKPVDTAAGSISDPKKLLKVDLDKVTGVSV